MKKAVKKAKEKKLNVLTGKEKSVWSFFFLWIMKSRQSIKMKIVLEKGRIKKK